MSVLVLAEHVRGQLREVTAELVRAARELRGPVAVAVVAPEPETLAAGLALEGVDEIVHVRAGDAGPEAHRRALEALVAERKPQVVLAGFTVSAIAFAPAVAAKLGLGFASDVHGLVYDGDTLVATRSFYAGKVNAELEFPTDAPVLLMLRPTAWPAATASSVPPRTSSLGLPPEPARIRHHEYVDAPPADVDIAASDLVLSIGRGIGEQENVELFERLATKMGAVLAASRPLVDAGWLPSACLVGQSGKTVRPKVYLAFGISGAVQHLAGMKGSDTVIAVNTDPKAAIFRVARYGAVADISDVAEELQQLF